MMQIARKRPQKRVLAIVVGTINRELALLKFAFNLGRKQTPPKVRVVPHFPMLKENNIRKGFLDDRQYSALALACTDNCLGLRALFETAYSFGFRRGELLSMRVNQVDFAGNVIRLEPGTTKNDEGRTVPMTKNVRAVLEQSCFAKESDDFVFTWKDGSPIKDFRAAWEEACKKAKVPDLIFHDLRRTGARNLRRAGVDTHVIMKIGGWKTDSVFRRYNIVNEEDLHDAARKLEAASHSVSSVTVDTQSKQKSESKVAN